MEGKLLLGGEVRRLHIIYFLTHMGKTEQPHLVRVHHLTRTGGVYLRDVKRWLGELRGKDMPDSYAWSYKRRYKTGYVWQDLLDEDLITPLSDNEYVLKGSEIVVISTSAIEDEKKGNNNSAKHVEDIPKTRVLDLQDSNTNPPSRIFSEINEEESSSSFGSERSSLTEEFDSAKFEVDQKGLGDEKIKITNRVTHNLENKKEKIEPSKGRKSFSGGVRNFITCGGVDTNDAVLVKVKSNRHSSQDDSMNLISACHNVIKSDHHIGRSSRVFGACFDHSEEKIRLPTRQTSASARKSFDEANASKNHEHIKFTAQRAVPATQRPVREPNCSQCGKPFKPQKLHSHMKSCKGMKNSTKSSIGGASVGRNSVSNSQLGSMNSIYKESSLGHFLKH